MKTIDVNCIIYENNSQLKTFTKCGKICDYFIALAKSSAEPANSNNKQLANSSTPFNRAFFVRSTRIPKLQLTPMVEVVKQHLATQIKRLISMVTCSGKGFALCCVPQVAVSQPVTRYRPSLRTLAVTSKILSCGVTAMFYKFLLLGKNRLKITILANSEQEARQCLQLSNNAICFARLSVKGANNG